MQLPEDKLRSHGGFKSEIASPLNAIDFFGDGDPNFTTVPFGVGRGLECIKDFILSVEFEIDVAAVLALQNDLEIVRAIDLELPLLVSSALVLEVFKKLAGFLFR